MYKLPVTLSDLLSGVPFEVDWYSPQAAGLLAWWPTIVRSDKLRDLGGRALNGTFKGVGEPAWAIDAILGSVLYYDGSNDYTYGTNLNLVSTPFTISAWVNLTAAGVYFSTGSVAGTRTAIHLQAVSATAFKFGLYNDDLNVTLTSLTGRWSHIAVTLDAAFTQTVYQDGRYVNSRSAGGYFAGNTNWNMGRDVRTTSSYFKGYIGPVQVNNVALPAPVIAQMANPQTMWDLYRLLRRYWIVNYPVIEIPEVLINRFNVNTIRPTSSGVERRMAAWESSGVIIDSQVVKNKPGLLGGIVAIGKIPGVTELSVPVVPTPVAPVPVDNSWRVRIHRIWVRFKRWWRRGWYGVDFENLG